MVETDASAERVPSDTNARARAVQSSEAELGCPRNHVTPKRTSAHPYGARIRIDLNPAETGRAHQYRVSQ